MVPTASFRLLATLLALVGCGGSLASDDAGMISDAGTIVHRPEASACTLDVPPPGNVDLGADAFIPDEAGQMTPPQCHNDSECDAGVNGRCLWQGVPSCWYDECFSDQACPTPEVCNCRGNSAYALWPTNHCLPSGNCRVDSDCPSGVCSPNNPCGLSSTLTLGFYCHTPQDTCTTNSNCSASNESCVSLGASWTCSICDWDL